MMKKNNKTNSQNATQIYASFYLGQVEFAIPVEKITEVLNPPAHYAQIPLAPPYLKGIFTTLSGVVPVIDLRFIFQIDGEEPTGNTKIAIIEYGRHHIGVLFDRTGQVFKPIASEVSFFENNNTDESTKIISGVVKKEAGKRMIQLVDLEALFQLEKIPFETSTEETINKRVHDRAKHKGERKQCISFSVGSSRCALAIDSIYEIVKIDDIKKSLVALHHCIGMIDLRGITVPVIDFSAFLGCKVLDQDNTELKKNKTAIVMKLGEELFGLIVNQVVNIITYYPDDLIKLPEITVSHAQIIEGCILDKDNNETILLDYHHIMSHHEISDITQGHNQIYSISEDKRISTLKTNSHIKKSYISFTIEKPFAIAIENVSEIINNSEQLIYPPELPAHIKGIFNLRGKLIPVINTRNLYDLITKTPDDSKIIILKSCEDAAEYGLIVDSVNSIIHFSENQKMTMPNLLTNIKGNKLGEDILEAVEIEVNKEERVNLLILNSSAVYKRIMGTKVPAA